ncbi:MAG: alpha-hydroxy-acid oxidizing protein [Acidimicrobiaceae bacterium]|nr:alpha-hydroxy-acid oxidizing protein [Acidimicrobiaceae bacterium]MXY12029.1 alpha-hydroxy-acid oxidizing protein [Acidimicrobiaceae bacterium]MXZ64165.1 alpha-hydroxy-acid oxidizing protein [Acidimicrobiaceae bacterium]MYE56353.1 alpha-hydroxy-acid oxidizing protein [Acidimicrobiaceae bacterium]MYF34741.1 alpha-hydroxy-acid oxidizing protein [Acidimicrobiaceae bacterium]
MIIDTLRSVLRFRRFEFSATKRRLQSAASIEDLRRIARRRLPGGVFDYIDGGAEDEVAMDRNTRAFRDMEFVPRVLRDMGNVDTTGTILGQEVPFPLILAPTGFTRIAHPPGELAVARAAERAGLPYSLSTMGTRSVEEVAAVSSGSKWFQVYVWRDKGLLKDMILRAKEAGFDVLCITVDAAMLGRRERDVRRGFTLPPKMGLDTVLEGMIRPGWSLRFAFSEPISFANVAGNTDIDGSTAVDLAAFMNEQFDPTLSWEDVEWMRSLWDGPVLVKGVQCVADAVIARDQGLDGIVLSNHGGRQLDAAPGIIDLVQPVAEAVGGDLDIVCDGGIRRGSDIVKALALGATSCMIGRPYLYGLAAAGEEGVDWVIEHLRTGMKRDMALCGAASVAELTPDLIYRVDTGR